MPTLIRKNPLNVKKIQIIGTVSMILFYLIRIDLSYAQIKSPEKFTKIENVATTPMHNDTSRIQDSEGVYNIEDMMPNPDSPEGKALLRQRTQMKIINVDQSIQKEVESIFFEIKNSIKNLDKAKLESMLVNMEIYSSEKISAPNKSQISNSYVDKLLKEYETAKIDISEFTIAITMYDPVNQKIKAILLNKDGIETGQIEFQKINDLWKIIALKG